MNSPECNPELSHSTTAALQLYILHRERKTSPTYIWYNLWMLLWLSPSWRANKSLDGTQKRDKAINKSSVDWTQYTKKRRKGEKRGVKDTGSSGRPGCLTRMSSFAAIRPYLYFKQCSLWTRSWVQLKYRSLELQPLIKYLTWND